MFVVEFFLFVISVCVLATMLTVVVMHMYLRAMTHPVTPMPAWVSRDSEKVSPSLNIECTKKSLSTVHSDTRLKRRVQ